MLRAAVIACLIVLWPEAAAAQDFQPPSDTAALAPPAPPAIRGPHASILREPLAPDTTRPRAVDLSDGYYTRLKIHQIGSYAMLPVFAAEFALGLRLQSSTESPDWVKSAHSVGALTLGGLFAANTVTGVWNLWEARHVSQGRTRRWIHTALMLAADAGFLYTASLAEEAGESDEGGGEAGGDPTRHRNAAIVSMSLATVSTLLMWIWKG